MSTIWIIVITAVATLILTIVILVLIASGDDNAQSDKVREKSEKIFALQEELDALKDKNKALEAESKGGSTAVLKNEYDALNKAYNTLKSDSEKSKKQSQQDLSAIQEKYNELKNKYSTLKSEKEKQISGLEADLNEASMGNIDDATKKKLAELDKLKKKVKDLEDDVDDLEDDVDSYKKKLKNKDQQLADTTEQLDQMTRQSIAMKEELEKTKKDLDDMTKELGLKVQSINFVQQILTAKADGSEDRKRSQKVDDLKEFISSELKKVILDKCQFEFENKEIFGKDADDWAATAKKNWLYKKTTIAFVGEFSAGKTSIVNRILSQDDPSIPLLPVSTKATTAIPTYISGADTPSYSFVTPSDEIKPLKESTFRMVNKDVLAQVKGVSSLIKYFVMKYRNPNLQNLSILDTPGFSSNDKEDASRTIEVINECDALFWVFDINTGEINRKSLKIIKDNLNKPLYIVINKIDSKSQSELEKVANHIDETMNDAGIPVSGYIAFSQVSPLEWIMNPIMNVQHNSDRDSYIESISELAKDVYEKQTGYVKEIQKEVNDWNTNIDNNIHAFEHARDRLRDDCVTASNIPHWEEHIFSSDRFEMSQDEGNRLIQLLSKICDDRPQEITDAFNNIINAVSNYSDAYKELQEEKTNLQLLQASIETLNNKIKSLK